MAPRRSLHAPSTLSGLALALAGWIGACSDPPPPVAEKPGPERAVGSAAAGQPAAGGEAPDAAATLVPDLNVAFLREATRLLSDDSMEGRRPGTPGGKRAVQAIVEMMKRAGLEPAGDGGGWTQSVPMRSVQLDRRHTGLAIRSADGKQYERLHVGNDVMVSSFGPAGPHKIDLPVVFAGYGVTAPEYDWDDYAGLDVKGKLVLVFVGDPPVKDGRFKGDALTYYGRWTYKFERALELGAAGCLVIHEDEPASYGWNVVQSSWSGPRFQILQADGGIPPALAMQGWISRKGAERLAKMAGASLEAWHAAALAKGFRAREVPVRVGGNFATTDARVTDVNVVGKLPGKAHPDEGIVLTAHWDHLGTKLSNGDGIFNGAVDNASGVAGMLAVAGSLARRPEKLDRTVLFVATTAEEQGLLGAKYHAEHPALPPAKLRMAGNLDSMNVHGKTRTVQVIGVGQTELEDLLAEVVQEQGRTVVPDERPGAGGYFRSDHFAFARKGVPAIYFRGGKDMVDGGVARGEALAKEHAERYHTVEDEWDPSWSFEGALQDAQALAKLVVRVSQAERAPAWKPGSAFGKIRAQAGAGK